MEIKAELLLATKNAYTGDILWTFKWTYPRIILAEINTHRMLSRNTSSSRAIPNRKQRARVLHDPFIPLSIGVNQKGMQAGAELDGMRGYLARKVWSVTRYPSLVGSWMLDKLGAHKQISNRLIEPWTWTEQVVTATDTDNLLMLRNNALAEPHFHELARQTERIMVNVANVRMFNYCREGEWHLPFIDTSVTNVFTPIELDTVKKVSAARCARVSYTLPTGKWARTSEDLLLFDRLTNSGHWSPLEHQATPLKESVYWGNLGGWKQFRKEFKNESGQLL